MTAFAGRSVSRPKGVVTVVSVVRENVHLVALARLVALVGVMGKGASSDDDNASHDEGRAVLEIVLIRREK